MRKWQIVLLLAVCAVFSPSAIHAQDNPSPLATVKASKLNVRSGPGTSYLVLVKVNRGQTLPVVGRNATTTWWQIDTGILSGWVNARFVTVENAADVPIVTTPTMTTSGCAYSTFMSPECPDKQFIGEVTTQKFEKGMMVWFNNSPSIFVLFGYGLAEPYPNKWAGEALPQETPPKGLQQPQLGFGQVWLNYKEVRKGLGWAADGEIHYQATIEYTGSSTPYPSDDAIFVSLPDGRVIWYSPYHTSWGYSG
jgi:uncharacterized protein YraI